MQKKILIRVNEWRDQVHTCLLLEAFFWLDVSGYLRLQLSDVALSLRDFNVELLDQSFVVRHLHTQQRVLLRLLHGQENRHMPKVAEIYLCIEVQYHIIEANGHGQFHSSSYKGNYCEWMLSTGLMWLNKTGIREVEGRSVFSLKISVSMQNVCADFCSVDNSCYPDGYK